MIWYHYIIICVYIYIIFMISLGLIWASSLGHWCLTGSDSLPVHGGGTAGAPCHPCHSSPQAKADQHPNLWRIYGGFIWFNIGNFTQQWLMVLCHYHIHPTMETLIIWIYIYKYTYLYIYIYIYMYGWWFQPTPLKNDGVRQLGWWHSQLNGKIKNVPNHQPVLYYLWTSWTITSECLMFLGFSWYVLVLRKPSQLNAPMFMHPWMIYGWKIYGGFMEDLWKIYGGSMEDLWRIYLVQYW